MAQSAGLAAQSVGGVIALVYIRVAETVSLIAARLTGASDRIGPNRDRPMT